MLKTFVMTGDRFELPIDIGIDKEKIESRIQEKDNWINNWFGWMYDSLCITADMDNAQPVLVSDYPEDKQVNDWSVADFIELQPSWEIHLPWQGFQFAHGTRAIFFSVVSHTLFSFMC